MRQPDEGEALPDQAKEEAMTRCSPAPARDNGVRQGKTELLDAGRSRFGERKSSISEPALVETALSRNTRETRGQSPVPRAAFTSGPLFGSR